MPDINDPSNPSVGDGEFGDDALGLAASSRQGRGNRSNGSVTVTPVGKRKLVKEPRRPHPRFARQIVYWIIGLVTLSLITYAGFYGYILYKIENNLRTSDALGTNATSGKGYNLLLMGLDTRLDEDGTPLPPAVYNALHAGEADDGGNNTNVLMYIHVSADGSKAVSISIPRDDWVSIPNCVGNADMEYEVGSSCQGKIKSAYGWAMAAFQRQWARENSSSCTPSADPTSCYQKSRDAARREEVQTVEQFLFGSANNQITSFVEITMGAFYQIAQAVGTVDVCVKENTQDSYSGANFHAGINKLTPAEAVAFVRQRRDLYGRYSFTDLDRSRRQQAFIVSLLTQMKSAGTLLNPITLNNIVNVASSNVVLSDGLDPLSVAKLASNLSGGNLHFYTLPIVTDQYWPSGQTNVGEVANQVNVPQIRAIVANLLNPPSATSTPSASPTPAPLASPAGYTVNAVNSTGQNGLAAKTLTTLAGLGYTKGTATTGADIEQGTTITYNPADAAAAHALAQRVGGNPTFVSSAQQTAKTLTLNIGTALAASGIGSASASASSSASALPSAVSATGGGLNGPATNQLSDMDGSGIPCVK